MASQAFSHLAAAAAVADAAAAADRWDFNGDRRDACNMMCATRWHKSSQCQANLISDANCTRLLDFFSPGTTVYAQINEKSCHELSPGYRNDRREAFYQYCVLVAATRLGRRVCPHPTNSHVTFNYALWLDNNASRLSMFLYSSLSLLAASAWLLQ